MTTEQEVRFEFHQDMVPPHDRKIVDVRHGVVHRGARYERDGYGYNTDPELSKADAQASASTRHYKIQDEKTACERPHVICGRCLGETFTLRYGNYSISARCSACAFEAEVYSG